MLAGSHRLSEAAALLYDLSARINEELASSRIA
ncbi:MAG: hypothetical protein JWM95_122 [Gemmatimonadetes bacterium]|jgi:hypothetical protein|nr:hypothetical protein [Gemmatimonadota bacterium]